MKLLIISLIFVFATANKSYVHADNILKISLGNIDNNPLVEFFAGIINGFLLSIKLEETLFNSLINSPKELYKVVRNYVITIEHNIKNHASVLDYIFDTIFASYLASTWIYPAVSICMTILKYYDLYMDPTWKTFFRISIRSAITNIVPLVFMLYDFFQGLISGEIMKCSENLTAIFYILLIH